ncbi:hypothetical protein, partial [Desulfobotulus alkaliphilus]|uniref:hypothetical protein n=1 Tax=Desulfobotulus alkaliphilus TaxID=622671 RepID=UPI001C95FBB5
LSAGLRHGQIAWGLCICLAGIVLENCAEQLHHNQDKKAILEYFGYLPFFTSLHLQGFDPAERSLLCPWEAFVRRLHQLQSAKSPSSWA